MKNRLLRLRRATLTQKQILLIGDLVFIVASALGSFALRLNFGDRLFDFQRQILTMTAIALLLKTVVYQRFGLYRRLWAYASVQELRLIAVAVTVASALLTLIVAIIQFFRVFPEWPRAALVIDWLLSMAAVGGLRFALRVFSESQMRRSGDPRLKRAVIVGAGEAGALVLRAIQKQPQQTLKPVCFVDDDPGKQKLEIHGVPVAGKLEDIPRIVENRRIQEVIIAMPSAPGKVVRYVADTCRLIGVPYRTMPALHELIGGKVSFSRLREVDITDLLRRAATRTDDALVGESLRGRRVLITGAGGSIGRELCRQAARWNPDAMILLGHGENSIFEILLELSETFPGLPFIPVIADVRDAERIQRIFHEHHPQVVFHAAAHKHVPLMEANVEEAITNNIQGTRNVVEAAIAAGVDRLVMISSDKAIRPSSVMGAAKRMAEMLVLDAARRAQRSFSVVRFGNVLGSRGSVIHLFRQQIARGGPVTVTHPEMRRYFMTIPEAVHLVLQASAMGQGGEAFVLNMGEQVRILDLAEDLIRLSGLEPGKDIEIVFNGVRPGEKLSEALWDEGAAYTRTAHPDVLRLAEDEPLNGPALQAAVDELIRLAHNGDAAAAITQLNRIIPHASVGAAPPPDMTAIV